VLDIAFGREVEGSEHLVHGLQALAHAQVKRYAAVDLSTRTSSGTVSALSVPLRLVDGIGHTEFQQRSDVLVYASEIARADGTVVSAMPVRVAKDLFGRPEAAMPETITVRIGPKDAFRQHAWSWQPQPNAGGQLLAPATAAGARLDQRVVIVGSLEEDANRFAGRSGPELIAWALVARMARSDEATGPRPLDSPLLFAASLVVFPLGSASIFLGIRSRFAPSATRTWWAAAAAVLLGLCCLVLLVGGLYALGHLYTQVTLVFVGIVIAVALAGLSAFHRELLASLEADLESGKLEAAEAYDIFISYSREPANAKWVREHVFEPLAHARHADGRPLSVFFDTRNLRVGDFWYRRLALAIAGSRYFVPVYSEDYFKKAFCVHELTLALARCARKPDFILPLARTTDPVPPGYDHIQHIDVSKTPDFIAQILARCCG
jgi:hypothetical protein